MTPPVRMEDAQIERLLRDQAAPRQKGRQGGCGQTAGSWTDLALQSACLSAFDICLKPYDQRSDEMVERSVMRRFTNRHYQFHSAEHFLQIKHQITSNLQSFLVHRPCEGTIMARFESFSVYVEELDMELSQHFHMVCMHSDGNGDYTVQKLVADENADSLSLYRHMTAVFGRYAFGRLPSRIEALLPLSGKIIAWKPDQESLEESLDYMKLVKSMVVNENGNLTLRN
ncbi:hypothetical protein ACX93W_20890 [Paenibacillus sp. CAU 1782]